MMPDIHLWPSVGYPERRQLPTVGGVYVALSGEAVVYVGESSNLRQRWRSHEIKKNKNAPPITHVAWQECDDRAARRQIEKRLTQELSPIVTYSNAGWWEHSQKCFDPRPLARSMAKRKISVSDLAASLSIPERNVHKALSGESMSMVILAQIYNELGVKWIRFLE